MIAVVLLGAAGNAALAVALTFGGAPRPWRIVLPSILTGVAIAIAIPVLRGVVTGGNPEFYLLRPGDGSWLHGHGRTEPGLLRFQPYHDRGLRLRLPAGAELELPVTRFALDSPQKLAFRDVWWNADFGFRRVTVHAGDTCYEVAAMPSVLRALAKHAELGQI